MFKQFETAKVADRDLIGRWRDEVAEYLVDVDCKTDGKETFAGSFTALQSDGFGLATLGGSRHTASRSQACIRRSGGEFYMLFLQRFGSMGVSLGDEEFEVRPGEFFFYDASIPHRLIFLARFEHIAVRLPKTLVRRSWRSLLQRGSFRLSQEQPLSRVAAAALNVTADSMPALSIEDLGVAIENIVDLFAESAAKARTESPYIKARGSGIAFARARSVIQSRLHDPNFSPDDVAADLGISRRSLNKLFQRQGIGPMEYIILQRLERAARDLSSPTQRGVSVSEVAFRWGFKSSSHFASRFRQHFGAPPSEIRVN